MIQVQKGLWDKEIGLIVHRRQCENWTPQGVKLGCSWGVQVSETDNASEAHVMATSVPALLKAYHLSAFDYCKIDVEGAERNVFAVPPVWVHDTQLMTIEVHEEPGLSGSSVTAASLVAASFPQPEFYWTALGEYHVYLRHDLYQAVLQGSTSKPDDIEQQRHHLMI